jgi:hypothetical protein
MRELRKVVRMEAHTPVVAPEVVEVVIRCTRGATYWALLTSPLLVSRFSMLRTTGLASNGGRSVELWQGSCVKRRGDRRGVWERWARRVRNWDRTRGGRGEEVDIWQEAGG